VLCQKFALICTFGNDYYRNSELHVTSDSCASPDRRRRTSKMPHQDFAVASVCQEVLSVPWRDLVKSEEPFGAECCMSKLCIRRRSLVGRGN